MEQPLFRKENIDRISSPEQLGDYLHVTAPAVWIVLLAVLLLVSSLLGWSAVTAVESYAVGTAEVRDGVLTLTFDEAQKAENVEVGMNVKIGEYSSPVLSVGQDEAGNVFAVAETNLTDGVYDAKVGYRSTRVIEMLFN